MNNKEYLKQHYQGYNDLKLAQILIRLSHLRGDCKIVDANKCLDTRINIVKQILTDRGVY